MLRHAVVLTVAVAAALGSAQQIMRMSDRASAPAPAAVAATADASAAPSAPQPEAAVADAQVVKSTDGHYWAEAQVDGRWIHCLIDTGASYVALTKDDAERLGIDMATLNYSTPVTTANGSTHAAPVDLDYVAVSGARVEHVPAMVIASGLSHSLLGMSYLGRLSRFEATPTSLILRP